MPKEALQRFVKAGYRLVGNHSAVEVCHWTRESLRKGRVCYKEKWYKIQSHRCLEMTPALTFCTHKCQFCWRPLEFTTAGEPKPDEPKEIIDKCIEQRKLLLTGFKSYVDLKKWNEAINPTNAAISLAGEPTLYPRISELIQEFHRRGMSTFLVTNGTRPDRLESLAEEPTSLYISLCSPDKKTYKQLHQPLVKDGWEKLNESLGLMKNFRCRKVIRITLVKGLNIKDAKGFARLILKAEPDFIEPKAYMHVGESQKRLPIEAMPLMPEVESFAEKLAKETGYTVKDKDKSSRVVLLSKSD